MDWARHWSDTFLPQGLRRRKYRTEGFPNSMQFSPDLTTTITNPVPQFGPVTTFLNVPPVTLTAPAPPSFLTRTAQTDESTVSKSVPAVSSGSRTTSSPVWIAFSEECIAGSPKFSYQVPSLLLEHLIVICNMIDRRYLTFFRHDPLGFVCSGIKWN